MIPYALLMILVSGFEETLIAHFLILYASNHP